MSGSISRRIIPTNTIRLQKEPDSPFSQSSLNKIFKIDEAQPDRLISRENTWLEFKENFNWSSISGYGRTCAGFANAKGGYIVFGVKDNPRIISGMSNSSFDDIDPSRISNFFNETFSPEIIWEMDVFRINGKNIGLLYIYESLEKPIISKKNNGEIKDGEIYYRYHASSERMKYPELRKILETQRKREQDILLKHIRRISRVGSKNAAILNTTDGTVVGSSGTFVIDESLLPQLNFIKEGEFSEVEGAPTLKLIGEVDTISKEYIQPVRMVIQPKSIRSPDIIRAFLNQEKVRVPVEYIREMVFENTGYLPIYYYIKLSNIPKEDIIEILQKTTSRSYSKKKIIERLSCDEDLSEIVHKTGKEASKKKLEFREAIIKKHIPNNLHPNDLKYLFQAVRSLDKSDFDTDYLLPILRAYFDAFYESKDTIVADYMRKAICHLDIILYKD